MKMMKTIQAIQAFIMIILVLPMAFAIEDINIEEIEAGITPENPLYFLDTGMEKISLWITFKSEKKITKYLEHAVERSKEMDEVESQQIIEKLQTRYEEHIKEANHYKKRLRSSFDINDTNQQIEQITQNHVQILNQTRQRLVNQTGIDDILLNAINKSQQVKNKSRKNFDDDDKGELVEDIDFDDYDEYIRPFNGEAINLIVKSNNGTKTDYYTFLIDDDKIYYSEEYNDETDYVITIEDMDAVKNLITRYDNGEQITLAEVEDNIKLSNDLSAKIGYEIALEYLEDSDDTNDNQNQNQNQNMRNQ